MAASDPLAGAALYADVMRYAALGLHRFGYPADRPTTDWISASLKEAGLATLSITRAQFRQTALGLLHHAGASVSGYFDLGDMLTLTRAALRERRGLAFLIKQLRPAGTFQTAVAFA